MDKPVLEKTDKDTEIQFGIFVGDRLRLIVQEPNGHVSARAKHQGNYIPTEYVGLVEKVQQEDLFLKMVVRWHLPASLGYNTLKGTTSTLIHIANGVWLEVRKRPRNVVTTIEKITEMEYQRLLEEAKNS